MKTFKEFMMEGAEDDYLGNEAIDPEISKRIYGRITSNDDSTIDVEGVVDFSYMKLSQLPLKFRNVSGSFYCHSNRLTSLEGAPKHVGGNFFCSDNRLTSLEGAPANVGGDFWCDNNRLTSLEGAPANVGGDFFCTNNKLTSLEGAPVDVGGSFWCRDNKKKFTKDDVREVCNVKGIIYI